MVERKTVNLNVPLLARVEGEGALDLLIEGQKISRLQLRIFEPPRFFEKMLQGRHYSEVPDMVSRICGICPVAYQISAVLALESLFRLDPGDWVRSMRRVFYCGEWLQSHSLHVHLLALPDFLGFESAPQMAGKYPQVVKRGMRLQAMGNRLISLFGARSVNPVGVRVGGFHKAPALKDVQDVLEQLAQAKQDVEDLLRWCISERWPQPQYPLKKKRFNYVALDQSPQYPITGTALLSSEGHHLHIDEFEQYFEERQVEHSTALHCLLQGEPYFVGPLARVNLFHQALACVIPSDLIQYIPNQSNSSFDSLLARVFEMYYAVNEAMELLGTYQLPQKPYEECQVRPGVAFGCSEAPRGILWHRYEVDRQGIIQQARIVPPTSQNQAQIEQDIAQTLELVGLDSDADVLRLRAEQVIRNYDPCISCATHFIQLNLTRT